MPGGPHVFLGSRMPADSGMESRVEFLTAELARVIEEQSKRKPWHLDKKIPLAFLGVLITQAIGFGLYLKNAEASFLQRLALVEQEQRVQHDRDERQDLKATAESEALSKRFDRIEAKLDRLIERR